MNPRPRPQCDQRGLFQAHFGQILNPDHALVVLADQIDWQRFDEALADCYCPDNGAPAKDVRLLVGLHYLKHALHGRKPRFPTATRQSDLAIACSSWRTYRLRSLHAFVG